MATEPKKDDAALEYQSARAPARAPTRMERCATFLLVLTWGLLAPSVLLVVSAFTINPVGRHWLAGYEFNGLCLRPAYGCSAAGILVGAAAGLLGRESGYALAVANWIALFLLPAFEYAG